MKKLLSILGLLCFAAVAFGQADPTPVTKWLPLINGYNLAVPTNAAPISLLSSNIEYTTPSGKIVYSYSNTGVSNNFDAFNVVRLQNDNNGAAIANATLVIAYGNTNLYPLTNASGFVTNWTLADPTLGSYVQGSANVYPVNGANSTNLVTINLVRSWWDNPRGDNLNGFPNYRLFEADSKATFTVTFSQAAAGGLVTTNLPAAFMQGVRNVTASISTTNAAGNGAATVINFIGISQPQQ